MSLPFNTTLALFDVGGGEMMLILFIVLLLFGGKRMPELARGLGKSIREFKKATAGVEDQIKQALEEPAPASSAKSPRYTRPPETIEPAETARLEAPAAPAEPAAQADAKAVTEAKPVVPPEKGAS